MAQEQAVMAGGCFWAGRNRASRLFTALSNRLLLSVPKTQERPKTRPGAAIKQAKLKKDAMKN